MENIRHWFQNGQPYEEGVALYLQHGHDTILKRLFTSEAKTPFKQTKLQEALRQLLQLPIPSTIIAVGGNDTPTSPPIVPNNNRFEHWPPHPIEDIVLKALWNEWKPLYGELKSLQQRLHQVALGGLTDPNKRIEAGQMAHRILDLDDAIETIYDTRDHYYRHGKLPLVNAIEKEEIIDPVRWATELKNNERYVREYRLKLKKTPDSKHAAKWAAALLEKQALVSHYRKLLKIDE